VLIAIGLLQKRSVVEMVEEEEKCEKTGGDSWEGSAGRITNMQAYRILEMGGAHSLGREST